MDDSVLLRTLRHVSNLRPDLFQAKFLEGVADSVFGNGKVISIFVERVSHR